MMTNETDIPSYKIDWVRVYQNKDDPKQKVGCSTPERPTSKYIQAHQYLYKREGDVSPLKEIQRGKGSCKSDLDGISAQSCGGPTRGLCSEGHVCVCRSGWTGPNCLVPDGFDPVEYEKKDGFHDLELTGPCLAWTGLYSGLLIMGCLAIVAPMIRRRMDGWQPLL